MGRSDPNELHQKLVLASETVQVGAIYRHRVNGDLYHVILLTMREEDVVPAVVYVPVEGPAIPWDRKITVFLERFHRVDLSTPSAG